jgi:ferredoxin-NADP reductase
MLLYRVISVDDSPLVDELTELARLRGIVLHVIPGSEIGDDQTDALGIPALKKGVPDIAHRDCFVCGPPGLISAMRRRLLALGVPRRHIHFERFEF